MMCVCDKIDWMENGWMDWIEWMWMWKVDGCGKWKVASGAVPDLTHAMMQRRISIFCATGLSTLAVGLMHTEFARF